VSDGRTLAQARRNAREALELCIEVYQKKGWPLPRSDAERRTTLKESVPVKLARV
jgi:predicted RNase H-like HicB family nuclease